ncbi:hypothetical protein [Frateuria defendens]|uniref:hypothetical protein n=1 Tax=Frateuria defendens TaxID=2219559 RepID=UPI0009E19FE4|nr:hypothetical protein [Frateuria defendens]
MKLLRDFIRMRTGGRFPLIGRRAAARRTYTVTVPAPRVPPAPATTADTPARAETQRPRLVARWHEEPPQPSVPLRLLSHS